MRPIFAWYDLWVGVFIDRKKRRVRLPEQISTKHHALADAKWTREAWVYLTDSASDVSGQPEPSSERRLGPDSP